VYNELNLKKSKLPLASFFTPKIAGAILFTRELFSNWAAPAFEALGVKKVGEIILENLEGTVFEGVEYKDGILDFSAILARLEKDPPPEAEFKKVFNKVSDAIAEPVKKLRGTTPQVYLLRKKILDEPGKSKKPLSP
jgi:hypothetical protein